MHCTLLTRVSMVFAVDIMHEHGLSNKMHPQLQPKKAMIRLYWLLISEQKEYMLYVPNKTERFSFNSGYVKAFRKRLAHYVVVANVIFVPLFANVLKCKAFVIVKFKCVSIAMYSLVMSPFLVT